MIAESNLFELCRMQLKFIKMYEVYVSLTITSTNGHLPKGKVKLDAYEVKFVDVHKLLDHS